MYSSLKTYTLLFSSSKSIAKPFLSIKFAFSKPCCLPDDCRKALEIVVFPEPFSPYIKDTLELYSFSFFQYPSNCNGVNSEKILPFTSIPHTFDI